MSERIDFYTVAPDLAKALLGCHAALMRSSLDKKLIELVFMRVSQLNGCAFCLDMHAHALRQNGETERRLHLLTAWRETELFDTTERAALAWAEALTHIDATHAPDEVYQPLLDVFTEEQIAELTFAIGLMNFFNRAGIGLRKALPNPTDSAWANAVQTNAA